MNYKILILFISLSSCITKNHQLAGEYENNPKMSIWDKANMYLFGIVKPISIINLNLFEDSTFMYKDCGDPKFGKWTTEGNELILNYEYFLHNNNLSDTVFYSDSLYEKMKISGNKIIDKYKNTRIVFMKK